MSQTDVAVVGAGSAGLWVAGLLESIGLGVMVFERTQDVGASWRGRYDGLRLNTVRGLSGLRGEPISRRAGRWPSRDDFIGYLEDFADRRRLHIRFGTEVSRIDRDGNEWLLTTSRGPVSARFVVVATGYDRMPGIPRWPGAATFTGRLLHASDYKASDAFAGKDVLVVGVGNTGTEIATQLAHVATRVRVAMRTPVNILPREVLGIPITVLARLSEAQPDWLGDRLGSLVQRLAFGDLSRVGMPKAPYGVSTELRVKGLGAVVDNGFVRALVQGDIELVGAVEALDGPEVVLKGGRGIRPETVIAATGYRHGLEALVGHLGVLLPSGKPSVWGSHIDGGAPRLYFNGYWLPASGQLPAMRRTSRQIARAITRVAKSLR